MTLKLTGFSELVVSEKNASKRAVLMEVWEQMDRLETEKKLVMEKLGMEKLEAEKKLVMEKLVMEKLEAEKKLVMEKLEAEKGKLEAELELAVMREKSVRTALLASQGALHVRGYLGEYVHRLVR
jgi:hypothetical protein